MTVMVMTLCAVNGRLRACSYVVLSQNNLTGTLPEGLLSISMNFNTLDVSDNHMTGTIPSDLQQAHGLATLALSNNNFHGTIPNSLSILWEMQ